MFGYILYATLQISWFYGGIYIVLCTLEAFAGFCSLIRAFTMDVQKNLKEFDSAIENVQEKFTAKNRAEFAKNFCDIIEFHSTAKQLSYYYDSLQ